MSKIVRFTITDKEYAEFVEKTTGIYLNEADALRSVFRDGMLARFPAYVKRLKNAEDRAKMTPEERARLKVEEEEAKKKTKKEVETEKGKNFCTLLGGKVTEGDNGILYCEYDRYEDTGTEVFGVKVLPVKEAIEDLQEFHITSQYFNSMWNLSGAEQKEIIIKKLKEKEHDE